MAEPDDEELASQRKRALLGFEAAAVDAFGFLEQFGYTTVEAGPTFVRYVNGSLFVNEFHGRLSYELGAEIGRSLGASEGPSVSRYNIRYLAEAMGDSALSEFHSRSTRSAEEVRRFLDELGRWLERYDEKALKGNSAEYNRMQSVVSRESTEFIDSMAARALRNNADSAWRAKNYRAVADAYEEIDSQLESVTLSKSERARLEYAKRQARA